MGDDIKGLPLFCTKLLDRGEIMRMTSDMASDGGGRGDIAVLLPPAGLSLPLCPPPPAAPPAPALPEAVLIMSKLTKLPVFICARLARVAFWRREVKVSAPEATCMHG